MDVVVTLVTVNGCGINGDAGSNDDRLIAFVTTDNRTSGDVGVQLDGVRTRAAVDHAACSGTVNGQGVSALVAVDDCSGDQASERQVVVTFVALNSGVGDTVQSDRVIAIIKRSEARVEVCGVLEVESVVTSTARMVSLETRLWKELTVMMSLP